MPQNNECCDEDDNTTLQFMSPCGCMLEPDMERGGVKSRKLCKYHQSLLCSGLGNKNTGS